MISCTQFIPAYSEGFKYLQSIGEKRNVIHFWEYLSDAYLKDTLQKEVLEKGIKGCFDYWKKSLSEEAADFTMTLDEEKGLFEIKMHHCPSKGMLNELTHMTGYENYCEHCDLLYRRVLEPLGFEYIIDLSETKDAKCVLRVRKIKEEIANGK